LDTGFVGTAAGAGAFGFGFRFAAQFVGAGRAFGTDNGTALAPFFELGDGRSFRFLAALCAGFFGVDFCDPLPFIVTAFGASATVSLAGFPFRRRRRFGSVLRVVRDWKSSDSAYWAISPTSASVN